MTTIILNDGRSFDEYGNVIHNDNYVFEMIYEGQIDFSNILVEPSENSIKNNNYNNIFNQNSDFKIYEKQNENIKDYDKEFQKKWLIPEEYMNVDVLDFLIEKTKSEEEIQRVAEEYALFEKYNMIPVLKLMIFLVDIMRELKIVWGVGRGSSAASYILFLIGVHKINSLKYNLDIHEFLK